MDRDPSLSISPPRDRLAGTRGGSWRSPCRDAKPRTRLRCVLHIFGAGFVLYSQQFERIKKCLINQYVSRVGWHGARLPARRTMLPVHWRSEDWCAQKPFFFTAKNMCLFGCLPLWFSNSRFWCATSTFSNISNTTPVFECVESRSSLHPQHPFWVGFGSS